MLLLLLITKNLFLESGCICSIVTCSNAVEQELIENTMFQVIHLWGKVSQGWSLNTCPCDELVIYDYILISM